jgi:hypothetical protein
MSPWRSSATSMPQPPALLDHLERRPGRVSLPGIRFPTSTASAGKADREFVVELMRLIEVSPTTTEHIRIAMDLPMGDFQDAMQAAAALACGAEWNAMRNVSNTRSPVPAVTPTQALENLVQR